MQTCIDYYSLTTMDPDSVENIEQKNTEGESESRKEMDNKSSEKSDEVNDESDKISEHGSASSSSDTNDDTDDVDYSVWDYTPDQSINVDNPSQSQPCCSLRGVSYTPPGWIRKYRKRTKESNSEEEAAHAPKKLKF